MLDSPVESDLTYAELFNNEGLTENQEQNMLEADIQLLEKIKTEPGNIKSFGYDGVQYQVADCEHLINFLQESLEKVKEKIEQRDRLIFDYFKRYALHFNQLEEWKENSMLFKQVADATLSYQDVYLNLISASNFMTVITPFVEIEKKMVLFIETEKAFKMALKGVLENPFYKEELTPEHITMFDKFLSEDWVYFDQNRYIDEDLDRLFGVIPVFQGLYYNTCFNHKSKFLSYQSTLFPETTVSLSA